MAASESQYDPAESPKGARIKADRVHRDLGFTGQASHALAGAEMLVDIDFQVGTGLRRSAG